MGHTGDMAETKEPQKKIVSETYTDEKGNIVKNAKDAAQIEVIEENPDGTRTSTLLVNRH